MSRYIQRRLPHKSSQNVYTPYHVGLLLSRHVETLIEGVRISKFALMRYLMLTKNVPVQKTTLYKVDTYVSLGLLPEDASWTDFSQNGRKALLEHSDIQDLIMEIKFETQGGEAMSSDEIKEKIISYTFQLYSKKGKLHELPAVLPCYTINSMISTIKAQCLFNIYNNVGNKTESRAIAEWSLRSTLAYTMTVITNHFIPSNSPTYLHPKKKVKLI